MGGDRCSAPAFARSRSVAWGIAVAVAAVCALACRQKAAQVQPTAEPTERIVYVVVTATPAPQKEDAVLAAALREQEMASYSATHAPATPRAYLVAAPTPALPPGLVAEVYPKPAAVRPYLVIEDFLVREPNSIGAIWFDGEVHNLGPGPANTVKILAKAYSINEVLLDSKEFYVSTSPLPPGERAHFNQYVRSNGVDEIRKVVPQIIAN